MSKDSRHPEAIWPAWRRTVAKLNALVSLLGCPTKYRREIIVIRV
jgi:hypothetical protein